MRRPFPPAPLLAAFVALGVPVGGDPAPQPRLGFAPGPEGTFAADWDGVAGRTYFMQFSLDLATWHYAPFIDFGEGPHSRGVESDSGRFFLRLHHADFPGIDSLDDAMDADFDGDGLSNIFELANGLDAFSASPNHDAEGDGLLLANEQLFGREPHLRDHPAVGLGVVPGN